MDTNFQIFRECLSTPLIGNSASQPVKKARRAHAGRKAAIKPVQSASVDVNDAAELGEFIDYVASEIFNNFPPELRSMTYSIWLNTPTLQAIYTHPISESLANNVLDSLPASVTDTLTTYHFLPPATSTTEFLTPVLSTFINTVLNPPPLPSMTKDQATECEICARSWIPLTYHHLIPRGVHEKVLKRGWHTEDQVNNVAWLCRACHSFVHRIASLEELAKDWYTVEKLLEREDVRKFGEWVGKIRWKAQ